MLSAAPGEVPAAVATLVPSQPDDEGMLLVGEAASVTYSGGVTVTDTEIITPADVIPRFAAQPTITAIATGSWSSPATWSEGRVPSSGDRVLIPENRFVFYSSVSDAHISAIEVGGSLLFSNTANTRLVVGTLTVMPTGTLQIGTLTRPVSPQVTAEIIIADQPLDLQNDPSQFGTGLIALGKVNIHGAVLNQTWTRLSDEPRAGDTTLVVSNPDPMWQAGDTLVLPDTRQVPTSQSRQFNDGDFPGRWEKVTIDHIDGDQIFLTQQIQFDHLAARDANGTPTLLPHVAILDRNVVIRSENPEGTRGHVLFAVRADIDVEYARFQDLGRTDAFRSLDNTTYDEAGNVTHIGTNQIARYAVHFHHVIGPENPSNTGYQFQLVGNTIDGALKWAVTVHGTSYGLVNKNVVYDAQGAGFATEDGTEIENVFRDNIAIRIVGTHQDGKSGTEEGDYGRGGSGFWFRRGGNTVLGNVAADATYAGFVFDGYFNTGTVRLPLFRGAMKMMEGQGYTTALNPPTFILNNEVYGLTTYGLWAAFISGNNLLPNQPRTTLVSFRVWNVWNAGIRMYHSSNVTIQFATLYADVAAQDRNDTGTYGLALTSYENRDLIVSNSHIEGMRWGILAPRSDASSPGHDRPTLIVNTWLKNYINVLVGPALDYGPGDATALTLRNVKFDLLTELPQGPADPSTVDPPANIQMELETEKSDLTKRATVKVYNYNQVAGDNFQVYFREQLASYVVPKTDPALLDGITSGTIGAPQAGLNNAKTWQMYGTAIGGKPVYYSASRPEINGLVGPIVESSASAPSVVIVTPWNGAFVSAESPVNVRYNVDGQLADATWVFFSLDGGFRFTTFENGKLYNLAPGLHTLRAWIGNLGGVEVPGTTGGSVTFLVAADAPSGQTVGQASASQANDAAVAGTAYDGITSALALQSRSVPDAKPRNAMAATVESPDAPRTPETSTAARMPATPAMRISDGYDNAAGDAPHDEVLGDGLLSELAKDAVAARWHVEGS